jgi:patatin-like phospholipase/acyl hydrolase
MGTIRILTLDGGGIRGIIAAAVLDAVLGPLRAKDVFHMIAGTSSGGVIACGLSLPDPLAPLELRDLYVEHGPEIFRRSLLSRLPFVELFEEKYGAGPLERHLKERLGTSRLSAVKDVDLIVPSYAIELPVPRANGETRAPLFFRSWQARGEALPAGADRTEYDFYLHDVARATSAAPTYFEPAQISNMAGQRFGLVDGGVFANNPTMCALVAAWRRYGSQHRFVVVSLGTGFLQRPIPLQEAKGWGIIGWARPILSVLMDGNTDTVSVQASEWLGTDHYRFDIALGVNAQDHHAANDDLDDASPGNIRALLAKADDLIATERERLAIVNRILSEPLWRPDGGPDVA